MQSLDRPSTIDKQATQRNTTFVNCRKWQKLQLFLKFPKLHLFAGILLLIFCVPFQVHATILLGSANTASLTNGLVGYWPFDGAVTNWKTNTTADLSGNGNTGTLVGMTAVSGPVAGKIGQALYFNGVYDYIALPANTTTFNEITITAWIRGDSTQGLGWEGIVFDRDGTSPIGLGFNGSGTHLGYVWNNNDANTYNWDSGLSVGNNQWTFVALTVKASAATIYTGTGGALSSATNAIAHVSQTPTAAFNIGQDTQNGNHYYTGTIDDVRIYNRALSAGEVQQLYKLGTANIAHSNAVALSNGLVGYWTFDGPATHWNTNTTDDVSGNGNTGMLVNMSTTTSPVAGKIGQALKFDGSTSCVSIPDNSVYAFHKGDFTVSAFVKPANLSSEGDILTKDRSTDGNYQFRIGNTNTGKAYFMISNSYNTDALFSGGYSLQSANALVAGSWTQITVTRTGSLYKMYINKTLSSSASTATTIDWINSYPVKIGAQTDSYGIGCLQYFNGTIDDVRIYNRAPSATEVK